MKNNFWIITMHNSNHRLRQVTLSGEVLLEYKFYVIGFSAREKAVFEQNYDG